MLAGILSLAIAFLVFSENKQATQPIDSSVTAINTAQTETKEIIAELGYGDDDTFPEVAFLPEENWTGDDMREVKKILIEREVIPQHDYFNVFNDDVLDSVAGEDMTMVKFEFREGSLSDKTGELEVWVKWHWVIDGKTESGGSIVGDSNKLPYIQRYVPVWFPNCLGGCKFSEEYLEKYPEAK